MRARRTLLGILFWTAVALFFSTQGYFGRGGGFQALETSLRRSLPQWYLWGLWSPPATTMVEIKALVSPDMLIEIEADAIVDA